jgi:transposase
VRLACHSEGLSNRSAARQFGISRETVAKMLEFSEPPGYRRTATTRRPKLDGFTLIIDEYITDDKLVPRKQRHTAKRIFERLRDEHGFTGGYTTIKDYVRGHHQRHKEVFVPLSHAPGHGQSDFGEAQVIIGGVQQKAHFFVLDLPHSDACYVRAYPRAVTEAWLDGHNHAFAFFGAVPQSIVYDNDRCLVARIMPDGIRKRTEAFSGFLSHYLIKDIYGRPGKGNDKGKAEGMVGYTRRNYMVPIPQFPSFDAFNDYLEEQCLNRQADVVRGHKASIGERLKADLAVMQPLPATPFDACHKQAGRVTSQALVRYKGNDYSVPVAYGHREVWIRGYVGEVVIGCKAEVIARHTRSYDSEDMIFNPLHYLPLIERKIVSLDQAAPLEGWALPEELIKLRGLLEARMGKAGKREYVQTLRLLETVDMNTLAAATRDALRLGAIGFDAIKHLVLCRIERRPAKLDLDIYPYLPKANVGITSASSYMCLIKTAGASS